MLCDLHTHSCCSPDADSTATIEKMALCAGKLGIDHLTVTDHCDCNFWYREDETEYPEYQKPDSMMFGARIYATESISRIAELKQRFPGLLCGIELGQPLQQPEAAGCILAREELDMVIGSLHMNSGKPDFYMMQYKKMDSSEIYSLLDSYFSELLEMCRQCSFDVLAHLTYPMRYIEGECGISVDMKRYDDIIREIFCTLRDNGKALEINTSGLRQPYGLTFPHIGYIKLFRSLGGELITLGSDAHRLEDIGKGIEEGAALAREAGFRYAAVFKQRKPGLYKL